MAFSIFQKPLSQNGLNLSIKDYRVPGNLPSFFWNFSEFKVEYSLLLTETFFKLRKIKIKVLQEANHSTQLCAPEYLAVLCFQILP